MRPLPLSTLIVAAAVALPVVAKLPALSDEAKAKAAEATAKAAWTDKVGLYQLCKSMDRVADGYRKIAGRGGQGSPGAERGAVRRSGPYAAPVTPAASKPLEAPAPHFAARDRRCRRRAPTRPRQRSQAGSAKLAARLAAPLRAQRRPVAYSRGMARSIRPDPRQPRR